MINASLTFVLELRGPVHTRQSGPGAFGVDSAMARNSAGQPIIPGTLVKGRLREALSELAGVGSEADFPPVKDLFGADTGDSVLGETGARYNEPSRGKLAISDFIFQNLPDPSAEKALRTRIAVDEKLGSVKRGALFVGEDILPSGAEAKARGTASFLCADEPSARQIARALRLAFSWIPQLGSGRSTGYGRILRTELESEAYVRFQPVAPVPVPGENEEVLEIAIFPDSPFCFAQPKIGGNLFESTSYIPGNALKGSVMTMVQRLGGSEFAELRQAIDFIRFRHALPSGDARARIAPLSVVVCEDGSKKHLFDVAEYPRPVVVNKIAPAFRPDWKGSDFERCDDAFGWKEPRRAVRVRTAIDSERLKSKDEKLFAQDLIEPGETVWRSVVDLAGVSDRDVRHRAAAQLRTIFAHGLRFLGKTKASARVETKITAPALLPRPLPGMLRITLQTAALLADPRYQVPLDSSQNSMPAVPDLQALYAQVWSQLSQGTLELSHFFATQSLAGGNYLYHRFQAATGKPYRPWLLTDAGSVFILRVADTTKAPGILSNWLTKGLKLPAWAKKEFTANWRYNPYIPQNGFGEIAVNLELPADPAAPPFRPEIQDA